MSSSITDIRVATSYIACDIFDVGVKIEHLMAEVDEKIYTFINSEDDEGIRLYNQLNELYYNLLKVNVLLKNGT